MSDPEIYPCQIHGIRSPVDAGDGETLCGICLSEAIDEVVTAKPLDEIRKELTPTPTPFKARGE